jgi:hypothetical protein
MKKINLSNISHRFLLFYALINFYYLLIPYFIIKTDNFFLFINPSMEYEIQKQGYANTLKLTNINLLFLYLTIISFILYIFLKKLCSQMALQKKNLNNGEGYFRVIFAICIILLIRDIYELIQKLYLGELLLFNRDSLFNNFLHNKKTTHLIVGSISGLYLFNSNRKLSLFFFFLLTIYTIFTFSRFELILLFSAYFLFTDRKNIKYLITIFVILVSYRFVYAIIIHDKSLFSIIHSILWEPCSIWINAIIKFNDFIYFLKNKNYLYQLIFDNFSKSALTNERYEQIFFKKSIALFTVSTARLGFIEFLSYPITILILSILALLQKKIISNFLNLKSFYYILSIYAFFFALRGSLVNGLLFINKFLLVIIVLLLTSEIYRITKKKL